MYKLFKGERLISIFPDRQDSFLIIFDSKYNYCEGYSLNTLTVGIIRILSSNSDREVEIPAILIMKILMFSRRDYPSVDLSRKIT